MTASALTLSRPIIRYRPAYDPRRIAMRERARRLRAGGYLVAVIARKVGVSHATAWKWTHDVPCPADDLRERQRRQKKRDYLRAEARREAARTGEPVEAIYARWGCA